MRKTHNGGKNVYFLSNAIQNYIKLNRSIFLVLLHVPFELSVSLVSPSVFPVLPLQISLPAVSAAMPCPALLCAALLLLAPLEITEARALHSPDTVQVPGRKVEVGGGGGRSGSSRIVQRGEGEGNEMYR